MESNYANYMLVKPSENADSDPNLQFLLEKMSQDDDYFAQNSATLNTYVNSKEINIPAFILRIIEEKEVGDGQGNRKGTSYLFSAWVGNLHSSSVPEEDRFDGGVYLPSRDKQDPRNAKRVYDVTKGMIDTDKKVAMKNYTIQLFTLFNSSTSPSNLKELTFGDMVTLQGVRVKHESKDGVMHFYNNVNKVDKTSVTGAIPKMYKTLMETGYKNSVIDFNSLDLQNGNGYGDHLMLHINNNIEANNIAAENSSVVVQKIVPDESAWVAKQQGQKLEEGKPIVNCPLTIYQWVGSLKDKKLQSIYVKAPIFNSVITPVFGIQTPQIWYDTAQYFLKFMPYVILGKIDFRRTSEMSLNINNSVGAEVESNYNCSLHLCVDGMFADFASYLSLYGIPVTKEYASTAFDRYVAPKNLIKRESGVVVCLNESESPKNIINDAGAEIRVIVNCQVQKEYLQAFRSMTPEQGDILIKAITANNVNTLPANHPAKGLMFLTNGPLKKTYFAVYMQKLSSGNTAVQKFISGSTVKGPQALPAPPTPENSGIVVTEVQDGSGMEMIKPIRMTSPTEEEDEAAMFAAAEVAEAEAKQKQKKRRTK